MLLSKSFTFEAAHRLAKEYKGKCANIHGHSFKCTTTVRCTELNQHDMGIDFNIIKSFNKRIKNELDHKLLLYKEDITLIECC